MKLKPNMYVRTKVGIFKIRKITKDLAYWEHEKRVIELDRNIPKYNYRFSFYKDERIFEGAKFKDNIIDLIQVGDYVNGEKVGYIDDCEGAMREYYYDYENPRVDVGHCFEEIKSVVTKQQFSQMEYKVGE